MKGATPEDLSSLPGLSTLASAAGDGTDAEDEQVLERGTSVGRYLVLERLGAGAMGVVYAAYDQELDRKIAIKILRARDGKGDKALRQERLIREAKAIAKLSHPNVVGIFDVGVHDGQVFLAMEYLGGGTLREWVTAKKGHWREIVKMFIEVGQGLAAAHAEGLIHRDFKPDNVLLDKAGKPKVVDFGLVRLSSAAVDVPTSSADSLAESSTAVASLTRTGAVNGTPAYMAPEQFLGKPVDARTDQFAFCIALYEALYGERPFAGETVMALVGAVTKERIRNAPKNSAVPLWIRRCLIRGLRSDPASRFAEFDDMIACLEADPPAQLRRRVGILCGVLAIGAFVFGLYRRAESRASRFERDIAARRVDADKAFVEARAAMRRLLPLRSGAFARFDANDRESGERVWLEARTTSASADSALERAQSALQAALAIDNGRKEIRRRLAEVLFERAALAELELRREDMSRYVASLDAIDNDGEHRRRWRQPGMLAVRTVPSDARISIERYDLSGPRVTSAPVEAILSSPVVGYALPAGSYLLKIEKAGYVRTRYPLVIRRGESSSIEVSLPANGEVPDGFTYVPGGKSLYGDYDEELRLSFLNAVPAHERDVHSFLIKTNETTFADWIAFISSLSRRERQARMPRSSAPHGTVSLAYADDWRLQLDISGHPISASAGEKLVYPARTQAAAAQDWGNLPVVGVSARDMRAYIAWLSATGKVPGARFCKEAEWERAARGADERTFPNALLRPAPSDANVDVTYGRKPGAYGPDEVGRHPAGRSPFGVDDMAGNVWEVVANDDAPESFVVRGGSYFQKFQDARLTNREPFDSEMRHHLIGLRVCADWRLKLTEGREQ